jgi:hypothetical protein
VRSGVAKAPGTNWSGSANAVRHDAPTRSAETRIHRIAVLCTLARTHREPNNAPAHVRNTDANVDCLVNFAPSNFGNRHIWTLFI